MASPLIALLTDFGRADWYVACMKAIMLSRCPTARLVDITHEIPPQDITAGAFILAAAASWFPPQTVFACVVDPGVGTRRALIAAHADRHILVGPDNGLLSLVLQRAKRTSLVRLTEDRYWLPSVSHTFQGRDIIAPVAAHLASRCSLARLGVSTTTYQTLSIPPPQRQGKVLEGRILHIDAFGNLITNLPSDISLREMSESEKPPSKMPWLRDSSQQLRYHGAPVRVVSSYQEGRAGELVALAGSMGYVELAIRNGSAAARCRAKRGDRVRVILERHDVR